MILKPAPDAGCRPVNRFFPTKTMVMEEKNENVLVYFREEFGVCNVLEGVISDVVHISLLCLSLVQLTRVHVSKCHASDIDPYTDSSE